MSIFIDCIIIKYYLSLLKFKWSNIYNIKSLGGTNPPTLNSIKRIITQKHKIKWIQEYYNNTGINVPILYIQV